VQIDDLEGGERGREAGEDLENFKGRHSCHALKFFRELTVHRRMPVRNPLYSNRCECIGEDLSAKFSSDFVWDGRESLGGLGAISKFEFICSSGGICSEVEL
jgi:hypothetical protein